MANPDPHCKIGKVTIKKTGAVIRVFESNRAKEARHFNNYMRKACATAVREFDDELAGFALIAWDKVGASTANIIVGDGYVTLSSLNDFINGVVRREIARIDMNRTLYGDQDENN